MHIHTLQKWKHHHRYNIEDGRGERNTRRVIVLTLSMMVIEITAGYLFGSIMRGGIRIIPITALEPVKSACWEALPVPWSWR
jgi:hypothetical protein